jgi:6-phosphogluconolactonase (cycloisomerase 2 family)
MELEAMQKNQGFVAQPAAILAVFIVLAGFSVGSAAAEDDLGAVYVLTNQSANSVMVFARSAGGTLSFSDSFPTGGAGVGSGPDPLGSQNSLVLGWHNRLLFAVNAGSNEISVFAVEGRKLRLLDRESSHGQMPVSITVRGNLVYVLNAGGTPNISGFIIDLSGGHLVHLPGSTRSLAGGAGSGPAQVQFSPDGGVLMVTEKVTNLIDTWTVNDDGYATHHRTTDSNGATPFGFTFTRKDVAIVTEATPSALSSYELAEDGQLELLTGTAADGGKANCWVVVTRDGRFAFTTNTGSGTISSYSVAKEGFLSLLDPAAGITGSGTAPIDEALSSHSQFLYVRDGVKGLVDGFRVENGTLTAVGSAGGVPPSAQGIAAR